MVNAGSSSVPRSHDFSLACRHALYHSGHKHKGGMQSPHSLTLTLKISLPQVVAFQKASQTKLSWTLQIEGFKMLVK